VLAYVAFALAPHTRTERAAMAKTQVQQQFTNKQQAIVEFVLAHYVK
jgi:type I restriction enzyme R subunit